MDIYRHYVVIYIQRMWLVPRRLGESVTLCEIDLELSSMHSLVLDSLPIKLKSRSCLILVARISGRYIMVFLNTHIFRLYILWTSITFSPTNAHMHTCTHLHCKTNCQLWKLRSPSNIKVDIVCQWLKAHEKVILRLGPLLLVGSYQYLGIGRQRMSS